MATLTIRRNADNTITVKFSNYQESISLDSKSPTQILDAVRYAALTAGVEISEDEVWAELEPKLYA